MDKHVQPGVPCLQRTGHIYNCLGFALLAMTMGDDIDYINWCVGDSLIVGISISEQKILDGVDR